MESLQKSWKKFAQQTQKSQQIVGQLSKLYIIIHENVRQTILKSTINMSYDPTEDCNKHLTTILDLLKRLNEPNDAYLEGVNPSIITKFEEQLYDLSEQVQKLLKTNMYAKRIDVKQLQGMKRENEKQEYGLKDQLKRSQQRRVRAKSGGKSRPISSSKQDKTTELIQKFKEYKKQFQSKKEKVMKQMEGHVQKKNNQVIFSKKYAGSNLQDYFKLRSQLLDLQLADQYTQKIVRQQQNPHKKGPQKHHKQDLESKLFSEFKIKTKYMKPHVKENIMNALLDVKLQLLEQYHSSNMNKLNEGNPDTLVALVTQRNIQAKQRMLSTQHKKSKHSSSTSTFHEVGNSPALKSARQTRQTSISRYPMAQKNCRPLVYTTGWTDKIEQDFRKTIVDRLAQGKVSNTIFH